MFSRMLNREVEVIIKGGFLISGFVGSFNNNFMEIKELGEFECTIINLDEIVAIRGRPLNVPHDEDNCKPFYPAKEISTTQLAAKVSKRPNDFSMPLPTTEQSNYQAPAFVRETHGSSR